MRRDDCVFVTGDECPHFVGRPYVIAAFLMLRVRVERRIVAAGGRLHFAHDPARGFAHCLFEQRMAFDEPGVAVERKQLAVVVQHFLEMRN